MKLNIDILLETMEKGFVLVNEILNKKELALDKDYNKINHTYYIIFCSHYESFHILMQANHYSSAMILLRTMLEIYVKSFYLELIEKKKNTNILDFINDKKQFPDFFKMVKKLENHTGISGNKFNGDFMQFTKSKLGSYEKLSLFSHGKGEYLKATFKHKKLSYTSKQITDAIQTAKGLFDMLTIFLMYIQGFNDEAKLLIKAYKEG